MLDAFDNYREVKREKLLYESIVRLLKQENEDWELKCQVMIFINQLINAETLEERVDIRSNFIFLNLPEIAEVEM